MNDLIVRRKRVVWTGRCIRLVRFVGRYVLALLLVPLSVLIGLGGLMQYWWRRLRCGPASRPEGFQGRGEDGTSHE